MMREHLFDSTEFSVSIFEQMLEARREKRLCRQWTRDQALLWYFVRIAVRGSSERMSVLFFLHFSVSVFLVHCIVVYKKKHWTLKCDKKEKEDRHEHMAIEVNQREGKGHPRPPSGRRC
jgi:hypothetical protein